MKTRVTEFKIHCFSKVAYPTTIDLLSGNMPFKLTYSEGVMKLEKIMLYRNPITIIKQKYTPNHEGNYITLEEAKQFLLDSGYKIKAPKKHLKFFELQLNNQ